MTQQPFLTTVVPAYNAAPWLPECLDSLLSQTGDGSRVILVDDGSTDGTAAICTAYAARYPRELTLVRQQNLGLGAARNAGLALTQTPYVTFLDSDDRQEPHFVRRLGRLLETAKQPPELVFSLPRIYDNVTRRVWDWYDEPLFTRLFGREDGRVLNSRQEPRLYALEANACRRVYQREFLTRCGFQFPEGVKWEDVQPHFYLLHRARRCAGLPSTGFYYRINRPGQITAGGGADRLDMIPVFRETLAMARREQFSDTEMSYLLRMLLSYTSWSLDVTTGAYREPLLEGLHQLYRTIPDRALRQYFNSCSPHRRKEQLLAAALKSPGSSLLEDYWPKRQAIALAGRLMGRTQEWRS